MRSGTVALALSTMLLGHFDQPAAAAAAVADGTSLLDVSNPDVVLSAPKPARSGRVALRIYEAAGRATGAVHVRIRARLTDVREANLLEDPGEAVQSTGDGFTTSLRAFEIKTFTFRLTLP
jgi:alpha-mannosidase